MTSRPIHECKCEDCQAGEDPANRAHHRQMNVLMSRLDEPQRRWYAAVESDKLGHGGDVAVSRITGLNVETIRRGRREMEQELAQCPSDRLRLPGGGRPRVEKKAGISASSAGAGSSRGSG